MPQVSDRPERVRFSVRVMVRVMVRARVDTRPIFIDSKCRRFFARGSKKQATISVCSTAEHYVGWTTSGTLRTTGIAAAHNGTNTSVVSPKGRRRSQ